MSTDAPALFELIDGVPLGWCLGRPSWTAHRTFYLATGRPMVFGEFSRLRRSCGRNPGAECLSEKLDVWRVICDQGERVVVQRTAGGLIRRILPADWKPPPAKPRHAKHAQPQTQPRPTPSLSARPKLTPRELRVKLGLPVS